jgi:hypothetical protein
MRFFRGWCSIGMGCGGLELGCVNMASGSGVWWDLSSFGLHYNDPLLFYICLGIWHRDSFYYSCYMGFRLEYNILDICYLLLDV